MQANKGEICLKKKYFVQFVCDNTDFNIETIDGKAIFTT